jgi:hypothetical protein
MADLRITRLTAVGFIGLLIGTAVGAAEPDDELKSATVLSFLGHSEWLQGVPAGTLPSA